MFREKLQNSAKLPSFHAGWFRSFKNLSAFYSANISDKAVNAGQEAAKTFLSC